MTTPTYARSTRLGRFYTFPDIDDDFPSVTTVIKMLAAPALNNWKVNQTALAAYRTRDWLEYDEETATEMIVAASKGFMRSRANLGTAVHQLIEGRTDLVTAIEDIQKAEQVPVAEEMVPYLTAAATVIGTLGEHFKTELTLINRTHGYAGTADVISYRTDRPSELEVTDWKTTKPDSTVGWREHQLQLAALAACPEYIDPEGAPQPLPAPITQLRVVGLRADGTYDQRTLENPSHIEKLQVAFVGLLRCLELDNDHPYLTIWDTAQENIRP